jgi:hypothetical protein
MHGAVTSLHLAGSAPHGLGSAGAVAAAVSMVFCVLALVVALALALTHSPPERHDGEDGDFGPGGGGRGPGNGGPDGPQPAGGDPLWWPEFERQFADYVTSMIQA